MTIRILMARALPLPQLESNGQPIVSSIVGEGDEEGAVALISTGIDTVDAATIAALPDTIGLIANIAVGTDNIDLDAAKARGILVSNTPVVTEDTADFAFALLLAASRHIVAADHYVRARLWEQGTAFALGQRVHGAKLGIVGFGAIGQAVARRAQGFGMDIRYWNRSAPSGETDLSVTRVTSLEQLVEEVDMVSIHLPLTPETHHLFDRKLLNRFKPGSILVNTARGAVVDEAALVNVLKSGQIAAAGLDVFEEEPRIHPDLLAMDQVVLAPHIGTASTACRMDMIRSVIANLLAFLETGQPINPVI